MMKVVIHSVLCEHSLAPSESIMRTSKTFLPPSRTKIFIRHPRTLFATEDTFQDCKHTLGEICRFNIALSIQRLQMSVKPNLSVAATRIQAKYKGYRVKGDYQKQREAGEC